MKAISKGRFTIEVYCILLSTNPESLLDIMNVNQLKFSYYKKQELYILGLAKSYEEALSLVKDIVEETYRETGDVKLREYYQDRWD